MAAEYAQSDQFRGARIHLCDLAGLEIRDYTVSGLKIVDCYPDEEYVVRGCLRVVLREEAEHHGYAVRDLAVLEAGWSR